MSIETKVEPSLSQSETAAKITLKLRELGCFCKFLLPVTEGPLISCYRFQPLGGTKVSQVEALAKDIALTLQVEDVLIKRIPGESSIGIWVPNEVRKPVSFKESVQATWLSVHQEVNSPKIPINLGVDSEGAPFVCDLTDCPHLLIAGSTGGGKSVLLSSIIGNIVYCSSNEHISFILSDTKGVEFGHFIGAKHLLFSPATSIYETLERMDWLLEEMERRLKVLGKHSKRNISEWNESLNWDRNPDKVVTGLEMSYIVLVIDELADLMFFKGEKRGESKIASEKLERIVQKSRATGIHVIAATQRPSVDIVKGAIKANFPSRLTFRLPSEADSRTVINQSGAEHLLSKGDCLLLHSLKPNLIRLHAPYASIEDIRAAVEASRYK